MGLHLSLSRSVPPPHQGEARWGSFLHPQYFPVLPTLSICTTLPPSPTQSPVMTSDARGDSRRSRVALLVRDIGSHACNTGDA